MDNLFAPEQATNAVTVNINSKILAAFLMILRIYLIDVICYGYLVGTSNNSIDPVSESILAEIPIGSVNMLSMCPIIDP